MTYDEIEKSADQGEPIELYEFIYQSNHYYFTNADTDIEIDNLKYLARAILRSNIEDTGEIRKTQLKLTVPHDLEPAELYRVSPPASAVIFRLKQFHLSNPDDMITLWTGRVLSVEWHGIQAEITLEPVYTALQAIGLRRVYQRQCPYALYSTQCSVDKSTKVVNVTVKTMDKTTITCSGINNFSDNYFAGGYIEHQTDEGITSRYSISTSNNETVVLAKLPFDLKINDLIKLYPGCDHTISTCQAKFNNSQNYGGMPYFAQKNPFGGAPIF